MTASCREDFTVKSAQGSWELDFNPYLALGSPVVWLPPWPYHWWPLPYLWDSPFPPSFLPACFPAILPACLPFLSLRRLFSTSYTGILISNFPALLHIYYYWNLYAFIIPTGLFQNHKYEMFTWNTVKQLHSHHLNCSGSSQLGLHTPATWGDWEASLAPGHAHDD